LEEKMDRNRKVYDLINDLDVYQNITFALTCVNRLRHLPKLFINSNCYGIEYLNKIIPKNTIENIIDEIVNEITSGEINTQEINEIRKLLDKMLLDDDIENSIEKQLFFYYVVIIIHILEYIKDGKINYIELCSDAMVEIINEIEGKKYSSKMNLDDYYIVDEKMRKYIDKSIDDEINKEIDIIKIIKDGSKETLNEYLKNNKIEYCIK
jgi:hypothetical protein